MVSNQNIPLRLLHQPNPGFNSSLTFPETITEWSVTSCTEVSVQNLTPLFCISRSKSFRGAGPSSIAIPSFISTTVTFHTEIKFKSKFLNQLVFPTHTRICHQIILKSQSFNIPFSINFYIIIIIIALFQKASALSLGFITASISTK